MEEELKVMLEEEESFNIQLEVDTMEVVTSNYEKLNNLPSINNVKLLGDKTAKELNLQEQIQTISNLEIEQIFNV